MDECSISKYRDMNWQFYGVYDYAAAKADAEQIELL
jgi:hypothetical protein